LVKIEVEYDDHIKLLFETMLRENPDERITFKGIREELERCFTIVEKVYNPRRINEEAKQSEATIASLKT